MLTESVIEGPLSFDRNIFMKYIQYWSKIQPNSGEDVLKIDDSFVWTEQVSYYSVIFWSIWDWRADWTHSYRILSNEPGICPPAWISDSLDISWRWDTRVKGIQAIPEKQEAGKNQSEEGIENSDWIFFQQMWLIKLRKASKSDTG